MNAPTRRHNTTRGAALPGERTAARTAVFTAAAWYVHESPLPEEETRNNSSGIRARNPEVVKRMHHQLVHTRWSPKSMRSWLGGNTVLCVMQNFALLVNTSIHRYSTCTYILVDIIPEPSRTVTASKQKFSLSLDLASTRKYPLESLARR